MSYTACLVIINEPGGRPDKSQSLEYIAERFHCQHAAEYDLIPTGHRSLGEGGLRQRAMDVLQDLMGDGQSSPGKSILTEYDTLVFIGYGVGGFLLRQIILLSETSSRYKMLSQSTGLLVFFGTPYRKTPKGSIEESLFRMVSSLRLSEIDPVNLLLALQSALPSLENGFNTILRKQYETINFVAVDERWDGDTVLANESRSAMSVPGDENVQIIYGYDEPMATTLSGQQVTDVIINKVEHAVEAKRKVKFRSQYHNFLERLGGYAITGSPPLSTCNRSLVPDLMDWIKVTETFASWVDASGSSVLHIMGQPGSGTTILSEHTIGFLRSNSNPDLVMASFTVAVVASASGLSQTTEMLVALSRQLLLLRPDAFQNCSFLCSWIMRIPRTIITETIAWSLLRCIVCAIRDPICFLIRHMDHLGQTPGWEHELVRLSHIGRPSQPLQIVVTTISSLNPTTPENYSAVTQQDSGEAWVNACRRCTDHGNPGLGQSFYDASYFSISLNGHQALLSYIEKGVRERVRRWTQGVVWSSLEEEVVSRICVPKTTYLLAKQQVDHLRSSVSHTSESELKRCLNMLPSTHDALYRRTLESLSKSKRDWAMAALAWIFLSFRRLDSGELALALAFEHGDIQDLESIRQNVSYDIIGDLTKTIGPFFKAVGDQFHPIHKAIGFITSLSGHGPKFHANATLTCLKYLSIVLRRCNIIGTGGKLLDELNKNLDCGFLHYCVIYWPDHCRSALSSHDNRDIVIRTQNLLETPPLLSIWSQLYGLLTESLVREQEEPVAPLSSVLNVACRFGLLPLAKEYALGHNGSRLVGEIWENALNLASQFGHADIVSWLLQNGTTSVDSISLAGAGGYAGIVDDLLANGSDLSLKDGAGYTALLRAAEHGHTNTVSRLLNSLGSKLVNETTPDGSSALHMAARIGHLEGVQKLIANGASVMQENQAGYIPLHLAAAGGYSDIILALTPGPVMLTRKTSLEDEAHTPLHLAAVSGNTEACRQLLRLGSVTLLTIPNEKGWTALHAAAHGGHLDIIRLFLDTLDAASVENQGNGNANAEESKDILATVPDESPATLAAANGHVAVMMELLNYKAKERQNSGSTIKTNPIEDLDEAACCLRSAVQGGQVRAVQQLLQIGVNASSSDSAGNTALQLAAQGNDLAVVETLLNKASLKAEDRNASLVLAVLSGNISIARKLMDDGAEVSISDSSHVPSRSPLHAAAKIGNIAMLSELVKTATGQRLFFLVIDDLVSQAAAHGHQNFIQALFTLNRRMREETPRLKNSGKRGHELSGRDRDVISRNTCEGSDKRDDQHFFEKLLITFQAWGDARAVEALLQAGFPCDFENVDETPLHIAAKYGHDTIIGFLIARGVEIQRETGVGDTALIIAVKKGHVSTCNCLLDLGADVNGTGAEEATALIVACRAGSRDLAELLLEHHADISAKNILGMTPLHAAVRTPELVRFLLGRHPKPATNVPNREGRTPLLEAIAEGSLESTDLLMADGVQLGHENRTCLHQAILSRHSAIVKRLLEKGASCDFSDSEYPMPLHFAAEKAFPEAVEYLVSEVPDINAVSGQSGTALNAAVAGAYSNPESGIRCVEILISNNADVNRYGGALHSPLQSAAWYEVEELARLFLDHGAEVDAAGGCFTTALNAAVQSDHVDLTRMLLDAGASPAIELEDGNTILSSAIARLDSVESVELVEALLSPRGMALSGEALGKGLQVAARDDKLPFFQLLLREGGLVRSKGLGLPPILFSALSSWGESVLNYLLGEGRSCIDVDETDVHGTTGLAYAVAGDHYYVDELLDAGANPNIADRTGNTPLILAVKAGNETFVESLLRPDRATRIDLFDFAGRGALYWACYSRNEDVFDAIMKRLGQESAAVHSLALHAAAARRADSMLDLLLVSGADPACLDRNNWSVYETANEYMATEMIERLPVVELRSRRDGLKRPTSWNRLETHTQVDVSDDGLTITLKSFLGPDDAANARSDFCMPNDDAVYYFEVTIEKLVLQDGETNAKVGVGFCEEHVSLDRMVGLDRGSWGYHADDGLLRIGNRTSDDIKYGAYGEGTTIGCGVDFRDHTAFFTKNGELLGNGCLDVRGKLYPAVSFGHNIAAGSSMSVNFGGNPEVKLKYDLPSHLLSSSSSNMPPKPEPTSTRDKRRTRTKRRLKRTGSIPAAT